LDLPISHNNLEKKVSRFVIFANILINFVIPIRDIRHYQKHVY